MSTLIKNKKLYGASFSFRGAIVSFRIYVCLFCFACFKNFGAHKVQKGNLRWLHIPRPSLSAKLAKSRIVFKCDFWCRKLKAKSKHKNLMLFVEAQVYLFCTVECQILLVWFTATFSAQNFLWALFVFQTAFASFVCICSLVLFILFVLHVCFNIATCKVRL